MRILIATGIFPPDIGGPATYSKIIAEEFSKRKHEIIVVTYGGKESRIWNLESSKIQNSKFQIPTINPISYTLYTVQHGLPKGIRHIVYFWYVLQYGRHADIIYAQDAVSAGLPALLAACILRRIFVVKIVGDHAWEQGMQRFGVKDLLDDFLRKRQGFGVEFLRKVQKFVVSHANRIIVPSEYLKSVVERWGITSAKIAVIPNAVSLDLAAISKEEARTRLNLAGSNFILLSIGRLVPWKGFQMLIELMPQLQKKISNVKFIIVGSGPDEAYLVSRISYLGLGSFVFLKGSMAKEQLALYLRAADIFLLNTGYEGFSHQLLEAMAAGIPVVATNAGGNKEVLKDGENALIAEYNNAADWEEKILQLYQDEALLQSLSRSNATIAERYSAERMIEKTEYIILNS